MLFNIIMYCKNRDINQIRPDKIFLSEHGEIELFLHSLYNVFMNDKLYPVKMPELLAPAGNLESAIAAFESGADAVYAGLGKFNAREMGENFTFDDMARLKGYAVKQDKKLYLTFNTLIKENELEEFCSMLYRAASLEPDAVIVQDLGAVQIIKDLYPSIDIHASTQMALHNSAGIKEAAKMGIKRVILERQVYLEEIEQIMKKTPVELEVFIHGALCCSLSGQCLLSSWLGGFSGNRGKCKQPCRRLYKENGKEGFFLSPGDLSTADMIGQFIKAGISSLKIEGRLKRGDYIKNTVSSYRKILDYYRDGEKNSRILDDCMKNLSRSSYTREFTHGFYNPVEIPALIKPEKTGLSGKYIGKVCAAEKGSFRIKLTDRLHVGDKIRIHNQFREEKNIITVTSLHENSRKVKSAGKGSIVTLSTGKRIPLGGKVYKTGETVALKVNRNTLPPFMKTLEADIDIAVDEKGFEVNYSAEGKKGSWRYSGDFEKADNNPVTGDIIERLFMKTGSERLIAGKINTDIKGSLFIPASVQKKIKNEFWENASEFLNNELKNLDGKSISSGFTGKYRTKTEDAGKTQARTILISEKTPEDELKQITDGKTESIFCSSINFYKNRKESSPEISEIILPHFCSESKITELEKDIEYCYEKGIRKFRLTSVYQLYLLEKYLDIEKNISYPFPVTNSATSFYLKSRGVNKVQGWIELDREAFRAFSENSSVATEIYKFGLPFVFATRAMLKIQTKITDNRGNAFFSGGSSGITYLYPDSYIRISNNLSIPSFYDLSVNIPELNGKFSDFNFSKNFQ